MEKQEFLKKLSEIIDELPQLVDEASRKTKEIVKYEFQQINKKIAFSPSEKDDILKEYKKRAIGELNVNMINDAGELNVKWYKDFLMQKLNFCSKWKWDSSTPENRLPAPLHMILLPREHVVIEITKVIYNKELIDYCNSLLESIKRGFTTQFNEKQLGKLYEWITEKLIDGSPKDERAKKYFINMFTGGEVSESWKLKWKCRARGSAFYFMEEMIGEKVSIERVNLWNTPPPPGKPFDDNDRKNYKSVKGTIDRYIKGIKTPD